MPRGTKTMWAVLHRLARGDRFDPEDEMWVRERWVENYNLNAGGEWQRWREPATGEEVRIMEQVDRHG